MRAYLSVGFLLLFCELATGQDEPIPTIDSIVSRLQAEGDFNGNILLSENGSIRYEKSFGYANEERRLPLTQETIFPLGSITKTFTAVAALQLVEKGKLKLDDPASKYLPDLPYRKVTVRHLLTHTSGIPEYQSDAIIKEIENKGVSPAALEKVLARLSLKEDFEPGSKWDYSNTNFILLALIVEKASGESYARFLDENIFQPAQMKSTFVLKSSIPAGLQDEVADGYRRKSFVDVSAVNIASMSGAKSYAATVSNLYGAGGIYSTARDLLQFHQALQTGKILRRETLANMYRPAELDGHEDYSTLKNTNYESSYGLGWFVARDHGAGEVVYHPGGTVGYVSYFLRNLTKDQCVIVLTNTEQMKHSTPTALLRILDGQPYQLDSQSLAIALGRAYNRHGIEGMKKLFDQAKADPGYSFREKEMNDLGYQLMLEKKDAPAALAILGFNAEKFPESFEVWDSLGEIHYQAGHPGEAIRNYEKSLQLNPKNEEGKRMLEKIKREAQ